MKNLYHKNKDKGKVYPSPSSSATAFEPNKDALSMLNLLPAAILALASVLSFEDREVLGYLITRSMKTTNPCSSSSSSKKTEEKNKFNKKTHNKQHLFDCGCFDCYTSYWFRWDSSPNRELIHQVIEAFEEYLSKGEFSKNNNYCSRGKKKDKTTRRRTIIDKPAKQIPETPVPILLPEPEKTYFVSKDDDDIIPFVELLDHTAHEYVEEDYKECEMEEEVTGGELMAETEEPPPPANNNHKVGLVSKVFPDVFGILNSRLWSLWGPNI